MTGADISLGDQRDAGAVGRDDLGRLPDGLEHLVPFALDLRVGGRCSTAAARNPGQDEPLLDAGNTVVAAELDMRSVAVADHVIDREPGAGDAGGTVVAARTPADVADKGVGASADYRAAALQAATDVTPM